MNAGAPGPARRPRRHDPERKQRVLDAALEVIATRGLVRTTHRLIAEAADVPLGSLTYHFDSLEDLCRQAFEQHATRLSGLYAAHFDGVEGPAALVEALTDLICGDAGAGSQDWAAAWELYLAALRDPALRAVTHAWMEASREVLERHVDPVAARGLDALVEGLVLHNKLSTAPLARDAVRHVVEQQLRP